MAKKARREAFDQFLEVLEHAAPPREFEPFAWYNAPGDSLEIYLTADHHVSERVNSLFTVFVAADDRERVVGLAIKNIQEHFGDSVKELLVEVGRATVNLLVYGALTGVEVQRFRLRKQRRKLATGAKRAKTSDRVRTILDDYGDTEVEIRNARELQPV